MPKEPIWTLADVPNIEREYESKANLPRVNPLDEKMIALSRTLATKQTRWTISEKKLFFIAISQLSWAKKDDNDFKNPRTIEIEKKDLYEKMSLNADNLPSGYLRNLVKNLATNSWIEFGNDDEWEDGFLIVNSSSRGKKISITFGEKYMPLLEQLSERFVTYWLDDLCELKPSAFKLYQALRLNYKTDMEWFQPIDFTTKQLKEIFGLDKEDYVKKDGKFDRYNFEKRCVQSAVDDINSKCKALVIKDWFKDYKGPNVYKYVFNVGFKTQIQTSEPIDDEVDENQMTIDDYLPF